MWRIVSAKLEVRVDRKATTQTTMEKGTEVEGEVGLELGVVSLGGKIGGSGKTSQERSFEHAIE
ncbi:hypothetical protein EW661_24535, partial [Escherichia coli]|uniref:hypothetical protein n=1 Tax=Escherichia coli TaxID=562 RepID=UPI001124AAD9